MLELEVLVRKLGAIDGLAASAIVVGEIAALNHEVLDDSVESRALVAETLFAGSKSTVEVSMAYSQFVIV